MATTAINTIAMTLPGLFLDRGTMNVPVTEQFKAVEQPLCLIRRSPSREPPRPPGHGGRIRRRAAEAARREIVSTHTLTLPRRVGMRVSRVRQVYCAAGSDPHERVVIGHRERPQAE